MRKINICLLYIFVVYSGFAQPEQPYPQMKSHWDAPGNYEVVVITTRNAFYPGDSLMLKTFFTGYGLIDGCKLQVTCSSPIFADTSFMYWDIEYDSINHRINYGVGDKLYIPEDNNLIYEILGYPLKDTTYGKLGEFYDRNKRRSNHVIVTETADLDKQSPYDIHLYAMKDISYGNYNLTFTLTYFNGKEWKSSTKILTVHVNSWLEEYPGWAWLIVIATGVLGIQIVPFLGRVLRDNHQKRRAKKTANESQQEFQVLIDLIKKQIETQNKVQIEVLKKELCQNLEKIQTLNNKRIDEHIDKKIKSDEYKRKNYKK